MAINGVLQAQAQSQSSTTGSAGTGNSTLDMKTFLQLLTTQLATQDPLNPMSDTEFFAQLAQMGTVQGINNLQASMTVQQAEALMGKTVSAVRPATDTGTGMSDLVSGTVQSLSIQNGQYLLNLKLKDGTYAQVQMGNIESISS